MFFRLGAVGVVALRASTPQSTVTAETNVSAFGADSLLPEHITNQTRHDVIQQWNEDVQADMLIFFAPEGQIEPVPAPCEGLQKKLGDDWTQLLAQAKAEEFSGKDSQSVCRYTPNYKHKFVCLLGLGASGDWEQAGGFAAATARAKKVATLIVYNDPEHAELLALGLRLASYVDHRFSGIHKAKKHAQVVQLKTAFLNIDEPLLKRIHARADGIELARDLVNAPANVATPVNVARVAEALANKFPNLTLKLFSEEKCKQMKMDMFLGVGRCSEEESQLIHLVYSKKPSSVKVKKVAIIGKTVTFDAGGYNIKVAGSGIEEMKADMGGASAVLGTAAAIAQLQPEGVEAHFIMAAAENMISGKKGAVHPGDILKAKDGTTVEINNTDAEGRMTMGDALVYAQEEIKDLDAIMDIATLTGASIISLGPLWGSLMSNNEAFRKQVQSAAKQVNEKVWPMPLEPKYMEFMKSDLADMKNTGPRAAGSITAALFLNEFINKDLPWAHIDMAGPCTSDKPLPHHQNAFATGYGVRTLLQVLENKGREATECAAQCETECAAKCEEKREEKADEKPEKTAGKADE